MKKKKAMKAIAAAGVALGGASYFQDANVVYVQAAENDGSTETVIEASEASETKEAEKTEEKPSETKAAESTETKSETSADGAGAPADGAGAPADGAGAPADDTGAPADDTGASTDDTETDVSQEKVPGDVTTPGAVEDNETSGSDTVIPPTGETPDEITDETTGGASEGSEGGSEEEDNLSETQEGSESTGPWSEAESTSTVNSTEFSNSYSEVTSVSEVGSASLSTETSEYTSTSESTSTVESTSMSKAESEYTSLSTAASEATSTYGSASTSLDSAYTSEVQSTATVIDSMKDAALEDDKIDENEAKDLAQAIIKYDLASKGLTLKGDMTEEVIKNENGEDVNVYRVSYIDSQGVVLERLYQYEMTIDGRDVVVNEAEISYDAEDGTETQGNRVDKDHNFITSTTTIGTNGAPTIVYTTETDSTGKTTVTIQVDDRVYTENDFIRQVNPGETVTYTYILDDGHSNGTSGKRILLNLDSNGRVKSYTVYEYSEELLNNDNSDASLKHVNQGVHQYDLLGGSPDGWYSWAEIKFYYFQYVAVADAKGEWHKLKDGNNQIVWDTRNNKVGYQINGSGKLYYFEAGSYIKADPNGNYHVYDKDGKIVRDLIINDDSDYYTTQKITTYNYGEIVKKGDQVEGYNQVITDQSTVTSMSTSASAASESTWEKSSTIDSVSDSNSIKDSTSASVEQSNITSESTSQSVSMSEANSASAENSTSASTSYSEAQSTSGSTSASQSTSGSTSASTSASTSTSQSTSTALFK